MKHFGISIIIFLIVCQGMAGQARHDGNNGILNQIEENNTVLKALRQQADAEKVGNKTGILPENPEIEYHYLWGNQDGNRTDFSVSQQFDFPMAYYHRKKVSDAQNRQIDLQYEIERNNILLETKRLLINLTYQNALFELISERKTAAEQLFRAYEQKYTNGDINVLEYNRAKISYLNTQKEYALCESEKIFSANELIRLNGGLPIEYSNAKFDRIDLPTDFQSLYIELKTNNLELRYRQQNTQLSRRSEQLQRSMNLPKIALGYMSEKAPLEHFQGVTVGLSVPLWGSKNTLKQQKAQTQAHQAAEIDAETRYFNETNALYQKAQSFLQLIKNQDITRKEILENIQLLQKALQAGQISLIEYLLESEINYELNRSLLETEREVQLAVAELMQWEIW